MRDWRASRGQSSAICSLARQLVRIGRPLNLVCRSLQDVPSLLCSPPVPARPLSLSLSLSIWEPADLLYPSHVFRSASAFTIISHARQRPSAPWNERLRGLRRVPSGCGNFGVESPSPKFHVHPKQGSSPKRLALAQQLPLCESKSSRSALEGIFL